MDINSRWARRSMLVLSLFSVSAFAAPLIVDSHIARQGHDREAVLQCIQALQNSGTFGRGVALSSNVTHFVSATGAKGFVLHGVAWQDGKRVPVAAQCVMGAMDSVASISRIGPTQEMLAHTR